MKTCSVLVTVFVALLAASVYRFIVVTDILKEVVMFGPVMCLKMPSSYGPEDIVFVEGTSVALMGVDDRISLFKNPKEAYQGGITAMKLPKTMDDYPTIYPLEMKNFPKELGFHPLGLHIFKNTLYVINHAFDKGGERIDVFQINGIKAQLSLTYLRSIKLPESMYGITNDLVMISETEFFITTWKSQIESGEKHVRDLLKKAKEIAGYLLGLELTNLYRCKDVSRKVECFAIASGAMMNGITKRRNELFVADTAKKVIKKFTYDSVSVTFVAEYPTEYPLDNLEYDPETDLIYVGVITRAWDYLQYMEILESGKTPTAEEAIPGGCMEFDPNTGKMRTILIQKRESGVSSCARHGMFIVMGSWHDQHALVCPMEDPPKQS